jgi:hypothetical protein
MAIREFEGCEVGEGKMGIERLEAPFDGGQGPEGAVASYMDGMIFYNICANVHNNDNCDCSGSNGMTI